MEVINMALLEIVRTKSGYNCSLNKKEIDPSEIDWITRALIRKDIPKETLRVLSYYRRSARSKKVAVAEVDVDGQRWYKRDLAKVDLYIHQLKLWVKQQM